MLLNEICLATLKCSFSQLPREKQKLLPPPKLGWTDHLMENVDKLCECHGRQNWVEGTYLQQSSPQARPGFSSGNWKHVKDVGRYIVLIHPCSLLSPSGTQDLNPATTRESHRSSSLWLHSHPRPLLIYIHSEIGRTLKTKKLVRENKISYINAYMWNLDKWYRWCYLQSRNRDTDMENRCMETKGERGVNREVGIDIYTLLCIK